MASIKMEELTFPSDCQIEPYLINLLQRMLDKDPKTRITLEEAMSHEWVTKEGVCPLQPDDEEDGVESAPGRERVRVGALRGELHVPGLRDMDMQQPRVGVAPAAHHAGGGGGVAWGVGEGSKAPAAAAAGVDADGKKGGARDSISGRGATAGHPRPSPLMGEASVGVVARQNKTASAPRADESRSGPYESSSRSLFEVCAEEINESCEKLKHHHHDHHHHSSNINKQEQRHQKHHQERAEPNGEEETGSGEKGLRRHVGQEPPAATTSRRMIGMGKREDDDETDDWSDGDDKVPSPRILEDIVDKGCVVFCWGKGVSVSKIFFRNSPSTFGDENSPREV